MERRGLSTIMALAMMLLITIIAISVAYVFISRMQTETQAKGSEQQEMYTTKTATSISVEGARGNQIYVRNSGKGNLINFTVYVNGELMEIDASQSAKFLKEGASGTLFLRGRTVAEPDVVKVVSIYGARDSYIVRGEETGSTTTSGQITSEISISSMIWRVSVVTGQPFRAIANITSRYAIRDAILEVTMPSGTMVNHTMTRLSGTPMGGNYEVNVNATEVGRYLFTVHAIDRVDNAAFRDLPKDTMEGFAYNWWNQAWRSREAIILASTRSSWTPVSDNRQNEPMWMTLRDATIASGNCSREIRVVSPNYTDIPFQIFAPESDPANGRCAIITQFNGSRSDYDALLGYVYFNHGSPPVPSYTTDLTTTGSCYENSKLKLCLGTGDDAAITYLGSDIVGKNTNLLSGRERDDKFFSIGVQPSMQYKEGFDSYWCTKYKVDSGPTLISDGPVAKVVKYEFSTECEGTTYHYRYNLYFYAYNNWYEMDAINLDTIEFFPNATGKSLFVKTKWDKKVVDMVPNEGWCDRGRCSFWGRANGTTGGSTELGVGVAIKGCSYLDPSYGSAYFLSLKPLNEADVSDRATLEPSRLTTRTVFTSSGEITERTAKLGEEIGSPMEVNCGSSGLMFLANEENN